MFGSLPLKEIVLSAAVFGSFVGLHANAALVDFDEATHAASFDNPGIAGGTGATNYSINSTGGVADSGFFSYYQQSTVNLVSLNTETFDLSAPGTVAVISADFLRQVAGPGTNALSTRVGFGLDSNTGMQIGGRIQKVGGDNYQLRVEFGGSQTQGATVALDQGTTWYRVESTITTTGVGTGSITTTLSALDASGDVMSVLDTITVSGSEPDLNDTTLYAGYQINNPNFYGIRGIDNFSVTVIPEPGAMGLLGLGGAMVLARRRRSGD